jgi:excisionase family DNA binding protein
MAQKADELMGAADVCDLLAIDRSTLARWAQSGKLPPALKMPGVRGAYLFHRRDVEALKPRAADEASTVVAEHGP